MTPTKITIPPIMVLSNGVPTVLNNEAACSRKCTAKNKATPQVMTDISTLTKPRNRLATTQKTSAEIIKISNQLNKSCDCSMSTQTSLCSRQLGSTSSSIYLEASETV